MFSLSDTLVPNGLFLSPECWRPIGFGSQVLLEESAATGLAQDSVDDFAAESERLFIWRRKMKGKESWAKEGRRLQLEFVFLYKEANPLLRANETKLWWAEYG